MHTKISETDYKAIGGAAALARATAIRTGKAWELKGYRGSPIAFRTRVTAEPKIAAAAKTKKR